MTEQILHLNKPNLASSLMETISASFYNVYFLADHTISQQLNWMGIKLGIKLDATTQNTNMQQKSG